jgi:hypothetical protein
MIQQKAVLIVIGAIVGPLLALTLGESVRPIAGQQEQAETEPHLHKQDPAHRTQGFAC